MTRILDWDTEFFGCRIARIEASDLADGATERWFQQEAVACAYLLLDVADQAHAICCAARVPARRRAGIVRSGNCRAVRRAGGNGNSPGHPADVEALTAIAREGHHDTRFYADGRFDVSRCDDLYATWIEKSCTGWADLVLVADEGQGVVGYVTLHRRGDAGEIGLIGVSAAARGRGVASRLLAAARAWCVDSGLSRATVATQGRNRAALGLYQAAGFKVTNIQLWYHRWFLPQ